MARTLWFGLAYVMKTCLLNVVGSLTSYHLLHSTGGKQVHVQVQVEAEAGKRRLYAA